MITKITLDMLTADSVSVRSQQYVEVGGVEYAVGEPHRRAYVNSVNGRAAIEAELPETQQNAIFAMWGESPTVEEEEPEEEEPEEG